MQQLPIINPYRGPTNLVVSNKPLSGPRESCWVKTEAKIGSIRSVRGRCQREDNANLSIWQQPDIGQWLSRIKIVERSRIKYFYCREMIPLSHRVKKLASIHSWWNLNNFIGWKRSRDMKQPITRVRFTLKFSSLDQVCIYTYIWLPGNL